MLVTGWRRIVNVGAAAAIAAVSLGAQATPATAAKGVLYGIALPATVASVGPAAGTLTPVVSLAAVGPNARVFALAADSSSGSLSALVGTCTVCPGPRGGGPVGWHLAQANPETGAVLAGAQLQRPLEYSIAVDPATHMVWGVANCTVGCTTQSVLMVDPSTGAETDAATVPLFASFDAFVALAPDTHTLYVAIFDRLFAVNTATRMVSTGVSIGPGITGLAVDSSNGTLFALRGGAQSTVERIDPATGTGTVLASFAGGLTSATVDSKRHTLFAAEAVFVGNLHEIAIVSVDTKTGLATAGTPINAVVGPLAFLGGSKHSDTV